MEDELTTRNRLIVFVCLARCLRVRECLCLGGFFQKSADEGIKELNCSLVYVECTAMRLTNKYPSRSLAILRFTLPAQVVKLVDTLASGASARKGVEVQVLSWAPKPKTIE